MGAFSTIETAVGPNTIALPMMIFPLKTSKKWVVPRPSVTLFVMFGILAFDGDTFAGLCCVRPSGHVAPCVKSKELMSQASTE
jgi:hypothetical protein